MLGESEALLGLNRCPHVADELLSLLVAAPDPGGVFKQGYQCHEGIIGSDHTGQHTQGQRVKVV